MNTSHYWNEIRRSAIIMKYIAIFLICMSIHNSNGQFPTNQDEVGMVAVDGYSTNIEVTCGFNEDLGPPLWVINGIIYDLLSYRLSYIELDSLYSIRIPTVSICLDNTTFQCLSSTIQPPGRVTRLSVMKIHNSSINCSDWQSNNRCLKPLETTLRMDTQNFNIGSNLTTFEFITPINCTDSQFYLQIYNMLGALQRDNVSLTCCSGSILSADLSFSNGGASFLRLIGVSNDQACEDNFLYYTFNDAVTNESIIKSDETLCLDFPMSTSQCNFNTTSLYMSSSTQCNLIISPLNIDVNIFGCYNESKQFDLVVNRSSNTVCLSNWSLSSNHTTVHFLCQTKCSMEKCNGIYNYVSSYEIFIDPSVIKIENATATTDSTIISFTPTAAITSSEYLPNVTIVSTSIAVTSTSEPSSTMKTTSAPFNIIAVAVPVTIIIIVLFIGLTFFIFLVLRKKIKNFVDPKSSEKTYDIKTSEVNITDTEEVSTTHNL